jgi:hypothetical protein
MSTTQWYPIGSDFYQIPIAASNGVFKYYDGFEVNNGSKHNLAANWIFSNVNGKIYSFQTTATDHGSSVVFTPNPVAQTISFEPISERYLGTHTFTPVVFGTSGLQIALQSATPTTCTVTQTTTAAGSMVPLVTLTATGTCTLTASQAGPRYGKRRSPLFSGWQSWYRPGCSGCLRPQMRPPVPWLRACWSWRSGIWAVANDPGPFAWRPKRPKTP